MRYSVDESTVLAGIFRPDRVVKIKILNLVNDALLTLVNDVCTKSTSLPGVYLWSTNNIMSGTLVPGYHNLLYEMYDVEEPSKKFHGKFVYGGYVDKEINVDLSDVKEDLTEIIDMAHIVNARL